jgi:DNA-binding GntR family transcriptional regulator
MSSSKFVPPKGQSFQTKQALVYHTLREAIMQVRLEPGERLVIDDIAKRLDVSPIPVREALQLLQSERLVEHKAHIGAVVSPITPESTREIFAILEALELATFRLALEYVTDADIKELMWLTERMEAVADNQEKWIELNLRFHRACAEIARMPRALEMLARISGEWERLRRHCYLRAGRPDTAAAHREHQALVNALAAKDEPTLERLVREHNRSAMAFYLKWEKQQSGAS